ncbi:MAG: hypothetical protein JWO68_3997 [Actinomycetia bacterium]|nr:hypothetical protein [Actinomycetes bacterium]
MPYNQAFERSARQRRCRVPSSLRSSARAQRKRLGDHMNRVAYILGTNHIYQRADESCEPGSVDAFREYLDRVCQSHGIKAIGEEMSISVLRDFNRTESIP